MNQTLEGKAPLTGRERTFAPNELIVSKTDEKGRITYANEVFLRISGYSEQELLGRAHNIIRHPEMPRCVFKFLWDTISSGREIFAYVINRCKNGDHYWVLAHVTPTFNRFGKITSYHSNRRVPTPEALAQGKPVYDLLLEEEARRRTPREQWQASLPILIKFFEDRGESYDEWVHALARLGGEGADV